MSIYPFLRLRITIPKKHKVYYSVYTYEREENVVKQHN